MQENKQPFYEGQKIVRTGPTTGPVVKWRVYTAAFCQCCTNCGKWWVALLEFPITALQDSSCSCGQDDGPLTHMAGNVKYFAPVETQYADATAEILEKFPLTEEVPDKILKPETVNN